MSVFFHFQKGSIFDNFLFVSSQFCISLTKNVKQCTGKKGVLFWHALLIYIFSTTKTGCAVALMVAVVPRLYTINKNLSTCRLRQRLTARAPQPAHIALIADVQYKQYIQAYNCDVRCVKVIKINEYSLAFWLRKLDVNHCYDDDDTPSSEHVGKMTSRHKSAFTCSWQMFKQT